MASTTESDTGGCIITLAKEDGAIVYDAGQDQWFLMMPRMEPKSLVSEEITALAAAMVKLKDATGRQELIEEFKQS